MLHLHLDIHKISFTLNDFSESKMWQEVGWNNLHPHYFSHLITGACKCPKHQVGDHWLSRYSFSRNYQKLKQTINMDRRWWPSKILQRYNVAFIELDEVLDRGVYTRGGQILIIIDLTFPSVEVWQALTSKYAPDVCTLSSEIEVVSWKNMKYQEQNQTRPWFFC